MTSTRTPDLTPGQALDLGMIRDGYGHLVVQNVLNFFLRHHLVAQPPGFAPGITFAGARLLLLLPSKVTQSQTRAEAERRVSLGFDHDAQLTHHVIEPGDPRSAGRFDRVSGYVSLDGRRG